MLSSSDKINSLREIMLSSSDKINSLSDTILYQVIQYYFISLVFYRAINLI